MLRLLLFGLLSVPGWLAAQQLDRHAFGVNGGSHLADGLYVHHGIGQALIATATEGTLALTQGVVQPDSLDQAATSTEQPPPAPLVHFGVYPNPTNDRLTLRFAGSQPATLQLALCDATGRILPAFAETVQVVGQTEWVWQLGGLASGVYLLTMREAHGSLLQTVRVWKQ